MVDKPSGLLTVATDRDKTDTLFFRLTTYLRGRDGRRAIRPHVVHRLDQETSGLVLLSKSREVQERLQEHWRRVKKTYWAVVEGMPESAESTVTSFLTESKSLRVFSSPRATPEARQATTHFRRLATHGGLSLLEIELERVASTRSGSTWPTWDTPWPATSAMERPRIPVDAWRCMPAG